MDEGARQFCRAFSISAVGPVVGRGDWRGNSSKRSAGSDSVDRCRKRGDLRHTRTVQPVSTPVAEAATVRFPVPDFFNPQPTISKQLDWAASYYKNIPRDLPAKCQLPDEIPVGTYGNVIRCPAAWK